MRRRFDYDRAWRDLVAVMHQDREFLAHLAAIEATSPRPTIPAPEQENIR